MTRPRLALVPGEPAGVGPELCVRALQQAHEAQLVVYGDPAVLQLAADALGLPLPAVEFEPFPSVAATRFGTPDPANARAVIDALLAAGRDCLSGRLHGMVTGPVHKAAINAGGIAYTGTTGLLADQAGCEVVMLLANPHMRVALATTHLPLREVADAIDADSLRRTLGILHAGLRERYDIADPRIAVLGLNPHAGEDGILGHEEGAIIIPLLEALRAEGMDLTGPLPADTAFLPASLRRFDAVLAMYHDQGLPVLKHSGFEQAVNVTLGLPYPRVAVDHGTALELAGRGTADPSSLLAAIAECGRQANVARMPS
ncbi:MAG: 4-hydroxythreonine-4-phosphate dehydrogenase PdxA [Pseudoxanthomonas suwonensis]|nr:4-hydroxythreonine-4-phosphate dehydrogenase PdxA [Pseudoxanthomonas suwonensis]